MARTAGIGGRAAAEQRPARRADVRMCLLAEPAVARQPGQRAGPGGGDHGQERVGRQRAQGRAQLPGTVRPGVQRRRAAAGHHVLVAARGDPPVVPDHGRARQEAGPVGVARAGRGPGGAGPRGRAAATRWRGSRPGPARTGRGRRSAGARPPPARRACRSPGRRSRRQPRPRRAARPGSGAPGCGRRDRSRCSARRRTPGPGSPGSSRARCRRRGPSCRWCRAPVASRRPRARPWPAPGRGAR